MSPCSVSKEYAFFISVLTMFFTMFTVELVDEWITLYFPNIRCFLRRLRQHVDGFKVKKEQVIIWLFMLFEVISLLRWDWDITGLRNQTKSFILKTFLTRIFRDITVLCAVMVITQRKLVQFGSSIDSISQTEATTLQCLIFSSFFYYITI